MSSMRSIYDVFPAPTASLVSSIAQSETWAALDEYVPVERSKMTFISIHIFANQNS